MIEYLATVIVTMTIIGLAYLAVRYKGQRDALTAQYGEAMQLVVNGASARRQAEMEFNNLKAVVAAWQDRPILAQLTDQQIGYIIQNVAGIISASQSKEPSRLN